MDTRNKQRSTKVCKDYASLYERRSIKLGVEIKLAAISNVYICRISPLPLAHVLLGKKVSTVIALASKTCSSRGKRRAEELSFVL